MESNDSPEIPDRGETSDIPGLPSGGVGRLCGKTKGKIQDTHNWLLTLCQPMLVTSGPSLNIKDLLVRWCFELSS